MVVEDVVTGHVAVVRVVTGESGRNLPISWRLNCGVSV